MKLRSAERPPRERKPDLAGLQAQRRPGSREAGRRPQRIVTDGVFTPEGEFLPLPSLDISVIVEVFRQLLLRRLHQAERLSEDFMRNLLSWRHPGFSVFAGPAIEAGQIQSLESQARYITRPAIAMDSLKIRPDGSLVLQTPPDPRTGKTSIALDPLEWIHRITAHIPDRGQHTRRS